MHRLAVLAALACACREPVEAPPSIEVARYAAAPSTKLDVLFQIDNSASTQHIHDSLAAALPSLLAPLADLDLHIGVISSDMGTTTAGGAAPPVGAVGQGGCADAGDDGVLQTRGAPVNDAYVVDEDDGLGGRRHNYTGDLATVLGQMLRLGSAGCGFEQPLAATRRALVNDANTGFARNDANLLVVMLMDEDDCSALDPQLFGPDSPTLGAQESFRCTRFGVVCDEPLDNVGTKTNCRPAVGSPYVDDTSAFVTAMRTVRRDPARVAVAAIAGDPTPVAIELRTPPGGGAATPALAHSCSWQAATGSHVADPAARIAAVVDALAPNASFSSICADNLEPAVVDVARTANALRGVICLDPARVGPDPTCSVTVESTSGEAPLTLCPAATDCFEIVDDVAACGDRPRLVVHLAAPAAADIVRARCVALD